MDRFLAPPSSLAAAVSELLETRKKQRLEGLAPVTPARSPEGQESHTPLGRTALDGVVAESAASGTRGPVLSGPPPHRRGPAGDCPSHVSPCPNSGPRSGRPEGNRLPSSSLDLGPRSAEFGQPGGEPQRAAPSLPRLRARAVAGVPIFPGFLARTVTGAEAAKSASPGLRGRPPFSTAAPGAPPAPKGSTRRRPAPASRPCPAAPPRAPPPSVNTAAARPPRPDAQVGACGAGRRREAAPSRVPTASAASQSADPEARARLPGRAPAQAARTPDEASGKRLWSPRFSALARGVWRCAFGTKSWGETRRQRGRPRAKPARLGASS
ncbi:basic proline-rich protein-like [Hyaena hyaena]|uniref:basic proline-rich protein-like n=1 Tax=Hyaena hyaena TaxID=95912 RepID=UPI0019240D51|nr:basic proline-rich protein-like [Hyaena hyaena]